VVGQQNADTADTLQLRDVAMATFFVFLHMGCTLAPPGEYDSTVCMRRRCGFMSNYFDHLLFLQSHDGTETLHVTALRRTLASSP